MEQTRPVTRDLWAYCGICAKWFYVARAADPDQPVTCPVCDVPSATFKSADSNTAHRVTRPRAT